jgi:hypothetical protein
VAAIVEVPTLPEDLDAEGIQAEVAKLLNEALAKHGVGAADVEDFVDAHLDRQDRIHAGRVVALLRQLLTYAS